MKRTDPVIFVSLGPGDPELITLKGLKALQQVDLIFCPGTEASSRALDILLSLGIGRNKIELFHVPMSKNRSLATLAYKQVAEKIAGYYNKEMRIAVTAEGDAGFYSSAHYISDTLHALEIPTKRIAGVPAFIACGALANIHVVKQKEELTVIPGIVTKESLVEVLNRHNTVVVMKPSQSEDAIKRILQEQGILFHYFENIGIVEKEYYTTDYDEIKNRKFPYFSLLIIQKQQIL